jgi:hypothetical protein
LLLEGGDLQELLAQVRDEHGAKAKIVSAERVRAGGLTGLLRAERYELTIELPDEPTGAAPAGEAAVERSAAAQPTSTRQALTAGAPAGGTRMTKTLVAGGQTTGGQGAGNQAGARPTNARPPAGGENPGRGPRAAGPKTNEPSNLGWTSAATAPSGSDGAQPASEHRDDVDGLLKLLDEREASTPDSTAIGPFQDALEAARAASGGEPGMAISDETIEFVMDPIFAPAAPAAQGPSSSTPPGQPAEPAPPADATASADVAAPAAAGPWSEARDATAHDGADPEARTSQQSGASADMTATSAPVATHQPTPSVLRARPASTLASVADQLKTLGVDPPLPGPADAESLAQKLASLGVPERVLQRLPHDEAYPAIVRALQAEPSASALPTGPGAIVVIVGELAGALSVAEDLSRILHLDAARILIASESAQVGRHIADPGDAGRQAVRLRSGDQPRLVCVDAPAPTAWVQQVVAALRPDALWFAVDATRKPADVGRQLRALPRVDALAVHALEATADPASPLALGPPVALLDGQPAGPHGWAALLCRRMYEEEYNSVNY